MTANLLMQFALNTSPVVRPTRCCFAPPIHGRFHGHTDLRTYISVTLVPSACTWLFRQIVASFVDMVFPDAIRTPFSSLWPLCGSEEASLGDTPDTHGPLFSPCSELLRSLSRLFHSAAILHRRSSKIVLFLQCFETVTSWEHCIDHNTTSARCLNLDNICKTKQEPPKHKSFRLSVSQLWQPKIRSDDLQPPSDYRDKHTHPSPLKGATHVSLPFASCSIFRAPQRVCHGSWRALQVNCREIPPY